MANIIFKRGSISEINNTEILDGQILFQTQTGATEHQIYADVGTVRMKIADTTTITDQVTGTFPWSAQAVTSGAVYSAIQTVDDKAETLEAHIGELNSQISSLNGTVNGLSSNVQSLGNRVTSAESSASTALSTANNASSTATSAQTSARSAVDLANSLFFTSGESFTITENTPLVAFGRGRVIYISIPTTKSMKGLTPVVTYQNLTVMGGNGYVSAGSTQLTDVSSVGIPSFTKVNDNLIRFTLNFDNIGQLSSTNNSPLVVEGTFTITLH